LARSKAAGEVVRGRTTFIVDWVINPDGTVSHPRMKGPTRDMSRSLPACFAKTMLGWKFPLSKQGVPVINFAFNAVIP
jgi:hypothetical protein